MTAALFGAIFPLLVFSANVALRPQSPATSTGVPTPACDPALAKSLEQSIRLNEPEWKLSAHYRSSSNTSVWEWKNGGHEMEVYVTCLASSADAARDVATALRGVAMPR